jgi:plastocyanin
MRDLSNIVRIGILLVVLALPTGFAQGKNATVEITDSAFEPGNAVIDAGSTVTWTNNDTSSHALTADDGRFQSGDMSPGGSFNFTFSSPGAYHYLCGDHPSIRGTVSVVPRRGTGRQAQSAEASARPVYQSIIAPTSQEEMASAQLDTPFKISAGRTALIKSEGIQVKFVNVTSDSRCPSDVKCVWAGRATIMVEVWKDGRILDKLNLTASASNGKENAKSFDDYSIWLEKLEPYPKSTQKIEGSDYVATLIVQKV